MAALPFKTISAPPEQLTQTEFADSAFIAQGMHEILQNRLSKLQGLEVIARASTVEYSQTDLDIKSIANELNVDFLVGGSTQIVGNSIRIIVSLIEAENNTQVWRHTYTK